MTTKATTQPNVGAEKPSVVLSYVETIPTEFVHPFIDAASAADMAVGVERRTATPYAGLEWFLPTAVLLLIARPYLDGLLSEAGKHHYHTIKRGLKSLWPAFFGHDRAIRITVFADPPGKVEADQPYSRALSIMAGSDGRTAFKLLIRDDASQEEYDAAVGCFLDFVTCIHSGVSHEVLASQREDLRPAFRMVLLTYDPIIERLTVVTTRAPQVANADSAHRTKGVGLLHHYRILTLHEAAVRAQLADRRDALFSGVNPHYKVTLQTSHVPADQMLLDLAAMNLIGSLEDGTVPLEFWLTNAIALTRMLAEARILEQGLRELQAALLATSNA